MEEAKGEFGVNEILASWYIRWEQYRPRWVVWALTWTSIFWGRLYSLPASVNTLIEAFALEQLPQLININRSGRCKGARLS